MPVVHRESKPNLDPTALELWPTSAFEKIVPKPPVNWRDLLGPIVGLRRSLSQLFMLAAALQAMALILPLFTQWLIDGPVVSGDTGLLGVVVAGFVLVTLMRVALEWTRGWLGLVATHGRHGARGAVGRALSASCVPAVAPSVGMAA